MLNLYQIYWNCRKSMGQVLDKIKSTYVSLRSWMNQHKWFVRIIGGVILIGCFATLGALIGAAVGGTVVVLQSVVAAEIVGTLAGLAAGLLSAGIIGGLLYYYDPKKHQILQGQVPVLMSDGIPQPNMQQIKWQRLQDQPGFSEDIYERIELFRQLAQFQEDALNYSCPLTQKVASKPASTKCCPKNLYEEQRLLKQVRQKKKCCICNKEITQEEILTNSVHIRDRGYALTSFRAKIRKTYLSKKGKDKAEWKQKIEQYMGNGYVEKYL